MLANAVTMCQLFLQNVHVDIDSSKHNQLVVKSHFGENHKILWFFRNFEKDQSARCRED